MSKLFKTISALFVLCLLFSCSDEDGDRELAKYGFNYNSQFYVLNTASYIDENVEDEITPSKLSIILSNVSLTTSNAISNITKLQIDFNGVTLEEGTIAEITDYSLQINGAFVQNTEDENFTYNNGTFLLNSTDASLTATEKSVTIDKLNFTDNTISLTFSFTRTDGQVFSGTYTGLFTDASVVAEEETPEDPD